MLIIRRIILIIKVALQRIQNFTFYVWKFVVSYVVNVVGKYVDCAWKEDVSLVFQLRAFKIIISLATVDRFLGKRHYSHISKGTRFPSFKYELCNFKSNGSLSMDWIHCSGHGQQMINSNICNKQSLLASNKQLSATKMGFLCHNITIKLSCN